MIRSLLVACLVATAIPCAAQIPVTLNFDGVLLADNTEFDNPFRSGETILGSFQRFVFDIAPRDHAVIRLGVFTSEHAGSASAVDHALPIVALHLGNARHQLILGTLDTRDRRDGFGPDVTTPHTLLPPLAVETAWFLRAYEAGGQWLATTPRYRHDLWFDYQVANTRAHREKFDTGLVGRVKVDGPLSAGFQAHIVHHGGQQYWSGPVSDSVGAGPGVILQGRVGAFDSASLELYGLAAYHRPNRADAAETIKGKAAFLRVAFRNGLWRTHLIAWRGDNFNHEDGDPNYLSRFANGAPFRRIRDYGEVGVARLFRPAPEIDVEMSFRFHRIESDYTYSYRVLGIVHFKLWQTTIAAPQ